MNNITRVLIGALFLFSGYMIYFVVVAEPPSEAALPVDSRTRPLPKEMKENTVIVPAGPAKEMVELLHGLQSVKTKKELSERNAKVKEYRDALIEGGNRSLPAIRALISDKRQIVRAKAVGMLRPIGTPESVKVLAETSVSGDKAVRLYALQEIEGLLPTRQLSQSAIRKLTVEMLLTSMADSNEDIRAAAARACWRMTQQRFDYDPKASKEVREKALEKLLNWWQKQSRVKR